MKKRRIFTPGPTPVMPEAQLAMARPIIHHRTEEFRTLLRQTRFKLQQIFRTGHEVLILASSGTGAMEAAVANLVPAGDKALTVVCGKFGQRWVEICEAHGVQPVPLCKDYGMAASPAEVSARLREDPTIKVLLLQGCETSTATSLDLQGIARAAREATSDLLIIVDAITALGTQPVETDLWGLDAVISGSQKSFAMSPGLAIISLSPRAVERLSHRGRTPYYFDLARELESQKEGQTAYTPAVSLVEALDAVCTRILEQGLESVVEEAAQMAAATRAGLLALGFTLLSQAPANAVTAAFPPAGISASALLQQLVARFDIKAAGGQDSLKGKIIRLAHLGYFDILDVFGVLSAIEICIEDLGGAPASGVSVGAAMASLRPSVPVAR